MNKRNKQDNDITLCGFWELVNMKNKLENKNSSTYCPFKLQEVVTELEKRENKMFKK